MGAKEPRLVLEQRGPWQRILVWGVPLDIIDTKDLETRAEELLLSKGSSRVVFLRVPEFMRALRNPEYKACLQEAALVVPVSKSLKTAMSRLGFPPLTRHSPFDFTVKVLSVLDSKRGSFYLLGGNPASLGTAENNLKATCPNSQSLGRYVGSFSKRMEKNILTAVAKASPHFLLAGPGLKGKDLWLHRRRKVFPRGIQMYSDECFDYFALRKKRPNKVAFAKGRDFLHELKNKPGKLGSLFAYFSFYFIMMITRLITSRKIPIQR